MRKSIAITVLCLCALMGVQAQSIALGTKWWTGKVLYTAQSKMGKATILHGSDDTNLAIEQSGDKAGEYQIIRTRPNEALPPVRGEFGWRVSHIQQEGMNFLVVRKPNGDACEILVKTPDDLENCQAQERFAEEQPVGDIITSMLVNTKYLGRFSKDDLRLMRNEILARHGWRFQSLDLKDHFAKQPWYKPVADNGSITLNIIEQTNVQMIKSEEAVPLGLREYDVLGDVDQSDFPGGLAEDGRGPDEVDGKQVWTVKTEGDFIVALGNNRTILIPDNVHLNLSRILEREDWFINKPGRRWTSDASAIISRTEPIIVSEEVFDGRQLTLMNFKHLTIKGGQNASIEVDPRYAFCLNFMNCENCEVGNLTIGHTEGGSCQGGVIGVTGGELIQVYDCDLYGCGTYGLDLTKTRNFSITNSNIHDCTYGILQLRSNEAVQFISCDFFNNREYGLIESWGSERVSFLDCRFFANWGDSQLFNFDTEFYLSGCEVYHPTENLGTINRADQSGKKNKFHPNPLDTSIKGRNLGPK